LAVLEGKGVEGGRAAKQWGRLAGDLRGLGAMDVTESHVRTGELWQGRAPVRGVGEGGGGRCGAPAKS